MKYILLPFAITWDLLLSIGTIGLWPLIILIVLEDELLTTKVLNY